MRSKVASEASQRRQERLAAMTPGARGVLALRLGEEGVASYIAAHGVDRPSAIRRIKAARRAGRRRSAAAEADEV
jgi:hypothetical protein